MCCRLHFLTVTALYSNLQHFICRVYSRHSSSSPAALQHPHPDTHTYTLVKPTSLFSKLPQRGRKYPCPRLVFSDMSGHVPQECVLCTEAHRRGIFDTSCLDYQHKVRPRGPGTSALPLAWETRLWNVFKRHNTSNKHASSPAGMRRCRRRVTCICFVFGG